MTIQCVGLAHHPLVNMTFSPENRSSSTVSIRVERLAPGIEADGATTFRLMGFVEKSGQVGCLSYVRLY